LPFGQEGRAFPGVQAIIFAYATIDIPIGH